MSAAAEPKDWTPAFGAVYTFEAPAPRTGTDITGHGHDLTPSGSPSRSSTTFAEGRASAQLSAVDRFTSDDPVFEATDAASFAFGGWFRLSDSLTGLKYLMQKVDAADANDQNARGLRLYQFNNETYCTLGNTGDAAYTRAEALVVPDVWVQLICRYDAVRKEVTLFVDGVAQPPSPVTNGVGIGTAPLELECGEANCSTYNGYVDEVFYIQRPLDDYQVGRVFACGIDGSQCECDHHDASSYVVCGRASCSENFALPTCDAAPP